MSEVQHPTYPAPTDAPYGPWATPEELALVASRVPLDLERIVEFCRRWGVRELALFGSVLRDDFDPDRSDVDVLFRFLPGVRSPFGLWDEDLMDEEIHRIFGRKVDLVEARCVTNPFRRHAIFSAARTIYAA